ncbi:hypothetical protein I4U23_020391 [Adineta vaga]|nr:hypothetical protein I4U23_020391 [Adineta vaga]
MSNEVINTLEHLPSELFFEIFRFINSYNTYKAFYGLNYRLSTLVLTHGMKYLDLSEINIDECQKILSDIDCSQVKTLKLSDKYCDKQINELLSFDCFPLNKFQSLHSLTLDSIGLYTIHSTIQQTFHLEHLKVLIIRFRSNLCEEKLVDIYKIILNDISIRLKSLKVLYLYISESNPIILTREYISSSENLSLIDVNTSLQYLILSHMRINDIETILTRFPNLCQLGSIVLLNPLIYDYPLASNLTCCVLSILESEFACLVDLLRKCPNLEQLTVDYNPIDVDALDGEQWENLIVNYLSKLKQFELFLSVTSATVNEIEDLIHMTFSQNKFWIERKAQITVKKEEIDDSNHGIRIDTTIEFRI